MVRQDQDHSIAVRRTLYPVISQSEIRIQTDGRGTYDLSQRVREAVQESGVSTGLCHVFVCHTSASLMICENADPSVMRDMETFMARQVPDGDPMFTHTAEGPDDMPAHVKSALTAVSLSIPVREASLVLGTWQGIYLWEHRRRGGSRMVAVHIG